MGEYSNIYTVDFSSVLATLMLATPIRKTFFVIDFYTKL